MGKLRGREAGFGRGVLQAPATCRAALLLAALPLLAGCYERKHVAAVVPPVQERLSVQTINQDLLLTLDQKTLQPGQAEGARLSAFLSEQGSKEALYVTVQPISGWGKLALESIADRIVTAGVPASQVTVTPVWTGGQGDVLVSSRRQVAVSRECGDFRGTWIDASDLNTPNFGCADDKNLAVMVADPKELKNPQGLAPAPGTTAVGAVERYNKDETKPLPDPDTTGTVVGQ
ncbi:CpaD family pilus assembly lipoprotein [Rhodovibrionaceae bacterium A322]